jgi:hypothetical protein
MAYLNFSELQGSPVAAPNGFAPSGLTALEWSVAAIARNDSLASLREPGRMSVALGTIFGGRRPNPRLADKKLEALRRVAVHAWRKGYAVPLAEIRGFHAAGYSTEQYETLLASISRGRSAARQQETRHEHAFAN